MKCVFETGSTDCVCYATLGSNDPVTSALHIIVGKYSSPYLHDEKAYLAMYVRMFVIYAYVNFSSVFLS